jgi:isopentenyl diphosphate isomerase/L-lactate dehydrogenase-like FMN-dependent dehydrogenase
MAVGTDVLWLLEAEMRIAMTLTDIVSVADINTSILMTRGAMQFNRSR